VLLINIDVGDLDAAERFYTTAFDLRVGRRLGDGFVELVGGEAPLYLLLAKAGTPPFTGAQSQRDYQRHWTPVHIDFTVDDIHAAIARAVAAGARQEGDVSTHAYGLLALMSDPFGNGFCLLQFTGRGYDEIA
jgi:predicted enzyme related to lactoylglutathione lyase